MRDPDQTRRFTAKLFQVSFWLLLLTALAFYFSGFLDRRDNPNRHLLQYVQHDGPLEVILHRNRSGHYIAPGQINGHDVHFLLDTGATTISVPERVARQAGLVPGRTSRVTTASGIVEVYQTELASVQLGNIRMHQVQAHINPHMPSDIVLLGMSFMKNLEMTQRDGVLTLRIPSE